MKNSQNRTDRIRMNRGYRQPSIYSRTKEQEAPSRNRKKFFWVLFLAVILCILGYLIFFSSIFEIRKTSINQTKYINRATLEKQITDFQEKSFLNRNLLILSKRKMDKGLEQFPGVESVEISKKYFHNLEIVIKERIPIFVWQVQDQKYLVDRTGLIWGEYEDKFSDKLVVIDQKMVPIEIGEKPVPANFSRFIEELGNDFTAQTNAKITRIEVADTTNEIKVFSDSTWYVYFDTTKTAHNQLINLGRILAEFQRNPKKKGLEYIDLRLDNKIFYK